LTPGGRYYVTRNGSSLMAFTLPVKGLSHFQIVASHSDSPTFRLKPHASQVVCEKYTRLNTEGYGGIIFSSWLDRPLSIAGRVLVREGNRLTARLVDLDRDALLIPNQPIHFNRKVNDGYAYNPQVDLLPLYGNETAKDELMQDIAAAAGVSADAIAAEDLYLYCRMPGSVWGNAQEYVSCPRIDDLGCVYTSLCAFADAPVGNHVNVLSVFDNEEVGSSTRQGADSSFLTDTLARIAAGLGWNDEQTRAAISASFMVSADNAHAVHPNHPEVYDADNRVYMNGGVVIKHNANRKYTTDGISCAIFSAICEKAGVAVQHFANRSDLPGGSTLGNIANTHASMNTVDIGMAQLAMHSCYETAGAQDIAYMTDALRAFYTTHIVTHADGAYALQ